jgi:hypothetical protein
MNIHSYRAECIGSTPSCMSPDRAWSEPSDSQSMLDRLFIPETQRHDNQIRFATLDVLAPQWDLLVVIQNSLEVLPAVVHIRVLKDIKTTRLLIISFLYRPC